MACECDACLEDVAVPPVDFVSEYDRLMEMAYDACWRDMEDAGADL